MKNRPVFTLNPQGEQACFSAFTPWGRGKKAEKPGWISICQSRTNLINKGLKAVILSTKLTFYAEMYPLSHYKLLLIIKPVILS
jgi:hypothetical protein